MSIHASGFMDTHLATTVAYLLETNVEHAQRLINDLRCVEKVDAGTVAVVADLIMTSLQSGSVADEVHLAV